MLTAHRGERHAWPIAVARCVSLARCLHLPTIREASTRETTGAGWKAVQRRERLA